jgi:hypothetical protein
MRSNEEAVGATTEGGFARHRRRVRIRLLFALFLFWIGAHNRKNWLFSDTVAGANASANLYALLQTCAVNGVDAYQYLRALLIALPTAQTADDYEALLPWNIALVNR